MIFSFGDINIDFVWNFSSDYQLEKLPEYGELTYQVGGVSYNFAKYANELGEQSLIIGKVGTDFLGQQVLQVVSNSNIKSFIIRDQYNPTGVISIFYFKHSNLTESRCMVFNTSNANQNISVKDMETLNLEFRHDDVLYITGYSLFRMPVYEVAAYIINKAQDGNAKIVFDLLPHKIHELGSNNLLLTKINITFKRPINLCIGEFRTWYYLLFNSHKNTPTIEDLKSISEKAKEMTEFTCIRYGYENCSTETLFYKDTMLYTRDTGYQNLEGNNKTGYGEKLTASLVQQLFYGRHSWLYNNSVEFTIPLSLLDLLPKSLPKSARIIDVGCGYGRILNKLKEMGFNNIFGLDTSYSMVKITEERYKEIKIFHSKLDELTKKDLKFDVCILFGILTTIQDNQDIYNLINSITEVLNDTGLLLIADFYINNKLYQEKYNKHKSLFPKNMYGTFVSKNGVINRHFDKQFVNSILQRHFTTIEYHEHDFKTIHGNISPGFVALCQKNSMETAS